MASFVHGDIKPDNICMRNWPSTSATKDGVAPKKAEDGPIYESEYEFTLIDFGIMSKFKLKKTPKVYTQHIGNLMFSSIRGLNCQ